MRKPDFLIIGAQKAGTTWLQRQLSAHSQLYLPDEELHFFDKPKNYSQGLAHYLSHFSAGQEAVMIGEKTPDYFWITKRGTDDHLSNIHQRIHQHLPSAKLIMVLRDPVSRALSALKHLYRKGYLSEADHPEEVFWPTHPKLVAHGVFEMGCYAHHLEAYRGLWSSSDMLVLSYEDDIQRNPKQGITRCLEFLGVGIEMDTDLLKKRINAGPRVSTWKSLLKAQGKGAPFQDWEPLDEQSSSWEEQYRPQKEKLFKLLA